jgi:sulfur carrier protein
MSDITVMVNGDPHVLDEGTTVADVVARVAPSPKGIAVAVNADVVPRSIWSSTAVADGDRIELLTAAQGG